MSFSITFIGCSAHFSTPRFCNIRPVTCHYSRKANRRSIIITRIITIKNGMIVGRHFSLTQTMSCLATRCPGCIGITSGKQELVFDTLPRPHAEQRGRVCCVGRPVISTDRIKPVYYFREIVRGIFLGDNI